VPRPAAGQAAYTVKTATNGAWQWWVDDHSNQLQVIAARDGYVQQTPMSSVTAGKTTTVNFALRRYNNPTP
jgi:hypothetical protein